MIPLDYFALLVSCGPELILVMAALAVLSVDLFFLREEPLPARRLICGFLTIFACIGSVCWLAALHPEAASAGGMLVIGPLTCLVKAALVILVIFTVIISLEAEFTPHVGEYFALLLLATVGMMFLVSSENLLMIFISLELASLSLYVLTGFAKSARPSAEAALKYFLFGGMAAAFTLYGLSLVYGLSGSINLRDVALNLRGQGFDPLLAVALVLTVTGFGFKIAAVPFHLWAPDAYEGAPTPSAALIASGSKVASFFVFAKVMILGFAGVEGSGAWRQFTPGWVPVLVILAALSVVLGNLGAIVQSNVKRLLAYSAIAHAGYALLGIVSGNNQGISSLVFYVVTYGLTTVGAFGVVAVVEANRGNAQLNSFAGLSKSAPLLSFCMMIFMLSLAGIPPLAGFFGKFYLFTSAMGAARDFGLLWLVVLAVGMSAVSLYYYLIILKQIYVANPSDAPVPFATPLSSKIALSLLAVAVTVFGLAPDLVVGRILSALKAAPF